MCPKYISLSQNSPPYPVSYLNTIIKGVSSFGLFLPGVEVLQKVVNDANSWTSKAKELEVCICLHMHVYVVVELLIIQIAGRKTSLQCH